MSTYVSTINSYNSYCSYCTLGFNILFLILVPTTATAYLGLRPAHTCVNVYLTSTICLPTTWLHLDDGFRDMSGVLAYVELNSAHADMLKRSLKWGRLGCTLPPSQITVHIDAVTRQWCFSSSDPVGFQAFKCTRQCRDAASLCAIHGTVL